MDFSLLRLLVLGLCILAASSLAFQSDELLIEDEEFGLEGGVRSKSPDPGYTRSQPSTTTRKRFSDSDSDSKIQFSLEHAFGDSDFFLAGTFTARLKTWNHGGQVGWFAFAPFSLLREFQEDYLKVEKIWELKLGFWVRFGFP